MRAKGVAEIDNGVAKFIDANGIGDYIAFGRNEFRRLDHKEGMVKRLFLVVMIGLAIVVSGCSSTKKGTDLEQSSGSTPGTKAPGGEDSSTDGTGDRSVSTENMLGLKTIYFDFDQYNLRDDTKNALDKNAQILMANSKTRIVIEGHCDERGTTEYNLALGEKRATTASDYLIRLGVDPAQISIISYGEERPADSGHDEAAWAKNRRDQFVPR